MIKKIRIQNFKSIVDTTIEFSDLIYVLAGQNEAGKSSILEAIHSFEEDIIDKENLNCEEETNGNYKQSISITYSTNELIFDKFEKECLKLVDENKIKSIPNFKLFDKDKLLKIKEYTLIKTIDFRVKNQSEYDIQINEQALSLIKSSIFGVPVRNDDVLTTIVKTLLPIININEKLDNIIENLWAVSPKIVYFDSVADLLPDEIFINELSENTVNKTGLKAVKNFEKIINEDFISLSEKSQVLKKGSVEKINKSISATFQKDWKQKISGNNQVEISFELSYDKTGKEKISFYIKSKDGVYLQPRRRSKGLIWFLSLWLELKASESSNGIVFLFDEPGQNLHVKANNDMLEVFKNLAIKGHQIIYTTHSPSLIELDKLHNIGLVLNTESQGTIVEGLTTSKLDSIYKRDALQPISVAMGLEPLKDFSILSKRNVLLEGLSDFWYFQAMKQLLRKNDDYKFVPGVGIKSSKIFPLISFCIGYGLEWLLIMDDGINPQNTKIELLENIFSNNEKEANKKVKLLNFKGVEDMFSIQDVLLLDQKINTKQNKKVSEIIGDRKIIFAKEFFINVEKGIITKEKLSVQTIKNFEDVFKFIDTGFNN